MITEPLQTSSTIYWLEPYLQSDYSVSLEVERDVYPRALAVMRDERNQEILAHIPRDWAAHVTDDEIIRRSDEFRTIYRRRAFECPAYRRIEVYRVSHQMTTFRIAPQGRPIITLTLRQLWYAGERATGALHDDVLYVVLVVEPTT
jgi:hypothetical protein